MSVHLEGEIAFKLLFDGLTNVQLAKFLHVWKAIEEEHPLGELLGVTHLFDRLGPNLCSETNVAPIGAHFRVQEVLTDGNELTTENFIQERNDLWLTLHGRLRSRILGQRLPGDAHHVFEAARQRPSARLCGRPTKRHELRRLAVEAAGTARPGRRANGRQRTATVHRTRERIAAHSAACAGTGTTDDVLDAASAVGKRTSHVAIGNGFAEANKHGVKDTDDVQPDDLVELEVEYSFQQMAAFVKKNSRGAVASSQDIGQRTARTRRTTTAASTTASSFSAPSRAR